VARKLTVAVGGTFEVLHKGHEALLSKAFEIGDFIYVGITSDELARKLGKNPTSSFQERERRVKAFVDGLGKEYTLVKLEDPYGPLLNKDVNYVVVTTDTMARAMEANEIRERNGLSEVLIYVIPFIHAYDGQRISSTKIKEGIMDRAGNKGSDQAQVGL